VGNLNAIIYEYVAVLGVCHSC